jgi:hypothetical protein
MTTEQNQTEPTKPAHPPGAKIPPIAWGALIILLVGTLVSLVFWLKPDKTPATTTAKSTVTLGHDYYVHIHLVEFKPLKPDGKFWDEDHSGPDALVKILWRGNAIYSISGRDDQLIASFDLFAVDVWNKLVKGEKLDVETSINAPLVNISAGDSITIEVLDRDYVFNDTALKIDIPLDTLTAGRNEIPLPESAGVTRLQIDMIDRNTPLSELIELQSKR